MENKYFKNLIHHLTQARIDKNLSAYKLSMLIGKNLGYVSQLEKGLINLSTKTLLDLCAILEINPNDLF